MDIRSARELAIFTPEIVLRNWREQRPNKQDDLVSRIMETLGESTTRR
jgi:hypothetical protein